jgi:predicted nuclease with TOPRIM domain
MTAKTQPVANLTVSEVEAKINRLAKLQLEKSRLETEDKALRAEVRTYLGAHNFDKIETPEGHAATIFTSTRINADRDVAEAILSPQVFAEIFKPLVVNTLRIK